MRKVLLAGLLMAGSLSVQAGMVQTDWLTEGAGGAVLHEETGKEWLAFNQTFGYNMNSIQPQLVEGGAFEGWRLPTWDEIDGFMSGIHDGVDLSTGNKYVMVTPENNMKAFFGAANASGYNMSYGLHYGQSGAVGIAGMYQAGTINEGSNAYINSHYDGGYSSNSTYTYVGIWLVSDGGLTLSSKNDPSLNINNPDAPVNNQPADVSAPAALGLMSMIGLLGWRRRRA